jgi:hypothetical protein
VSQARDIHKGAELSHHQSDAVRENTAKEKEIEETAPVGRVVEGFKHPGCCRTWQRTLEYLFHPIRITSGETSGRSCDLSPKGPVS